MFKKLIQKHSIIQIDEIKTKLNLHDGELYLNNTKLN